MGSLVSARQGVIQITKPNSTRTSSYGIYDTETIEKVVKLGGHSGIQDRKVGNGREKSLPGSISFAFGRLSSFCCFTDKSRFLMVLVEKRTSFRTSAALAPAGTRLLLITVDDKFDSVGVYGSKLEGTTPVMDAGGNRSLRTCTSRRLQPLPQCDVFRTHFP